MYMHTHKGECMSFLLSELAHIKPHSYYIMLEKLCFVK